MPDPNDKDPKDPNPQDPKNPDPKDPKDPDPKDPDPKDPEDPKEETITISKSKWDQMYARTKKAEDRLSDLEKEKKEEDEAKKREAGEFEELANQHKAEAEEAKSELAKAREELKSNEEVFQTMLDQKMEAFSDEQKTAIDGLEGFSVRQKLNYISTNEALFAAKEAGKKGQPPQPKSNADKPDDEIKALEAERDELNKKAKSGRLLPQEQRRAREIGRKLSALRKEQI